MSLPPALQTAFDNFQAALTAFLAGPNAPVPVVPDAPAKWYRPTAAQTITFAARFPGWTVADVDGDRQSNPGSPTSKQPLVACDGTAADAMTYASFGFLPDGLRYNWRAVDREASRVLCDKIYAAASAQAANTIVPGAGDPGATNDLDYALIMCGQMPNANAGLLGQTGRLAGGIWQTVDAWVAWFMSQTQPGPGAPGPGIGSPDPTPTTPPVEPPAPGAPGPGIG